MHRTFMLFVAFLLAADSMAQEFTRFQNGRVADATAINENFDTVVEAINLLKQEASLLTGEGDPGATIGADGDLYLNTLTLELWGPRAEGQWILVDSLKGSSCTVLEENGGIYVRCEDGSEVELSAPPSIGDLKIGTFTIEGKTVDLIRFEHSLEREVSLGTDLSISNLSYSAITLEYSNASGLELVTLNSTGVELTNAIIVLSGGTAMRIDLSSFYLGSKETVVAADGATSTKLTLAVVSADWIAPASSLSINQVQATSQTDCQLPTQYTHITQKPGEEAIVNLIWGKTNPIQVVWALGSPPLIDSPLSFDPVKISHASLDRLPCFFDADVPQISTLSVTVDAASETTLTLNDPVLAAASVSVSKNKEEMHTSWMFTQISESSGDSNFCYNILTNSPC